MYIFFWHPLYIAAFVGLFVLVVESVPLYQCASLFIHSPVAGRLGIMNSAALKILL